MTKPGWQTSEFWATILTHVAALVALFAPGINVGQWVQPLAVVIAGAATAVYAHSRSSLKKSVAPVLAAVQTAAALSPATVGEVGQVTAAAAGVIADVVGTPNPLAAATAPAAAAPAAPPAA